MAAALPGGSAMDAVKLGKEALDLLLVPLLDKTARRSCHGYADLPGFVPAQKKKAAAAAEEMMGSEAPDETSSTGSFDGFSSDVNNGVDSFVSGAMSPENSSSSRASAQWDAEIFDSNASVYSSPLPWLPDRARSDDAAIAAASSSSAAASSAPSPSPSPSAASSDLLLPRTGGDGGCAGASSGYGLPCIINSQGSKGLMLWDAMDPLNRCDAMADRCKDMADASEAETMKERFAKLLLGEDLSGGGKGVSTALAVSNAITNLSAAIFGELWHLEPLAEATKQRWRKEMERLLSVSDYIVEFVPCAKSLADGSTMKVMDTKPRLDLHICLPALRKLDAMLIEGLDSFVGTEFWYVADRSLQPSRAHESQALQAAMAASSSNRSHGSSSSDGGSINRWWLPAPMVPADGGLSGGARKHLQQQRESVNQILKAAMAVNAQVLAEMMVPSAFTDSLPKNGRSSLGEPLYREMSSERFSASELIAGLDAGRDEHAIVDLMNSVEAALHIWRRKLRAANRDEPGGGSGGHGSSELDESHGGGGWQPGIRALRRLPKDGLIGPEKRQMLMDRAESLLLLLRLKFPGLPQSILDVSKIQYCKDVGQSILESYSRVLESLAYNVRSRIDDILQADDAIKARSVATPRNGISKNTATILASGLASPRRHLQSQILSQSQSQILTQSQILSQSQSQILRQNHRQSQSQSQSQTPKGLDPPHHHRHWLRHHRPQ